MLHDVIIDQSRIMYPTPLFLLGQYDIYLNNSFRIPAMPVDKSSHKNYNKCIAVVASGGIDVASRGGTENVK